MPQKIPGKPPQTVPQPSKPSLNGSLTVAEIVEGHCLQDVTLGKRTIRDAGKRLAQIRGLKPGSSSIRTVEMIEEILTRLTDGETMTSILCDAHMPAPRTMWNWCDRDEHLANEVSKAQAHGQRVLADLRMNIAAGGEFSTGDARRDEILIKAINANLAQRNRAEFGERATVNVEHTLAPVMLPTIALPSVNGIEDDDPDDDA